MFRYLKDGGYDTYWFGKNDALTDDSFPSSLTEWDDLPTKLGGVRSDFFPLKTDSPLTMLATQPIDRRDTSDYALLQRAIGILERKEQERPFCIFLPLVSPHPPYIAPIGFDSLYSAMGIPPLVPPGLAGKPSYHAAVRNAYGLDKATDKDFRQVRATDYGQVSYADWLLGELMEALDRTGRSSDTVLVASSDHGDYAGDFGLVEKWPSGLETCLRRVPLVARMPGGASGHVVDEMVELFDIMATFLEFGEIRPSHTHFARSLLPQLRGAPGDARRAAYSDAGYDVFEPQAFEPPLAGPKGLYTPKHDVQNQQPGTVTRAASVITREFNYVARPGDQSELYDRKADPQETQNLIDSYTHRAIREQLGARLLHRLVSTTGVPPMERDNSRGTPVFHVMPNFPGAAGIARELLDR